ncbi:MAG: DUF2461 domain-containing protein [Ignavibacteriae bacterium]|nr:DUF2461 domain-containing protein [Ignavibacteriota bacterium]MCB9216942.1 DUF2461 domain-containing protein [Ignavibacteria bacterium]
MAELSYYDYPPFTGFSAEGIDLLKKLKKNNRREWLTDERKEVLKNELMLPMELLLADIGRRAYEKGVQWNPNPKKSIFRIYRDTRFSKEKKPFKTNIGATLPYADEPKKGIGCYIHVEPGSSFFGAGGYFIEGEGLKNLRTRIEQDPVGARKVLKSVEKKFAPIQGEQLKRAPVGYDPEHPAIDLLRYKQFWTMREIPDELIVSPKLPQELFKHSLALHDFCTWLYEGTRGL